MSNKNFLNAKDIALYLNVSTPKAYKIIRSLNSELSKKGYLTIAGKVSRAYFEEKVYGNAQIGG